MFRFCGTIKSPSNGPIIYLIVCEDVLYIGETQKHPICRWNAHLMPNSDFRKRLESSLEQGFINAEDMSFWAFHCATVRTCFEEIRWKTVTQAIEHELHCLVLQRPSMLGKFFNLISDTEKTAPRRFTEREFAKEVALAILDEMARELSKR